MFIPIVTVPLTDDRKRQCVKVLRDALRAADLTLDQAAREAERDVRQFARQLDGIEGSLSSLWKQPDLFWQEFAVEIAAVFGISRRARRAAKLHRVTLARKRQARMTGASTQRRTA